MKKMVGGFHGVLLPSAKYSGQTFRWENTLRKAVRHALQRTNNSVWIDGRISPNLCKRPVATASVWSEILNTESGSEVDRMDVLSEVQELGGTGEGGREGRRRH